MQRTTGGGGANPPAAPSASPPPATSPPPAAHPTSFAPSPSPLSPTSASAGSGRVPLSALCGLSAAPSDAFAHSGADLTALRSSPSLIVDVWSSNLRESFARLNTLVDAYPYVALDTEFPGVVARPLTAAAAAAGSKLNHAHHYQTIKLNVDMLKLIQLGLCFCTAEGEVARATGAAASGAGTGTGAASAASSLAPAVVFQFHFKFSLADDMYAQDSIDVLTAAGIDFSRHARDGIDAGEFAELLLSSGLVLNDDVRWLTFHSGFDFAYLLHLLLGGGQGYGAIGGSAEPSLPQSEAEFFDLVTLYFPAIYDVKQLLRHLPQAAIAEGHGDLQHGGLQKVAQALRVSRLGRAHQAGSDALLTAAVFFRVRDLFFSELIPPTVAQLQQAAATASAAVMAAAASSAAATEREKEAREREAYIAASDSTLALQHSFQQVEEKYLGLLYGLQPTGNSLLRAARQRERSHLLNSDDSDDSSLARGRSASRDPIPARSGANAERAPAGSGKQAAAAHS